MGVPSRKALLAAVTMFAGLSAMGAAARADEVMMSDGSKIVGDVQQVYDGKVKVKTAFAGDMSVDAAKVKGISTSKPVTVQFKSGERIIGPLSMDGSGATRVGGENPRAVDMGQVNALWPAGGESPDDALARTKALASAWKFSAEAGIIGETGNTERFAGNAAVKAKRETDTDRLYLYLTGRYARENGNETTGEIIGGAKLESDLGKDKRLFWFIKGEAENDKIEQLELRATGTAGLGYWIIRKPNHEFKVFGGPGFQHESYENGDNRNQIIAEVGETYRIDITPWLSFTHGITWFPTFEELGDYRIVMENAAEVPINPDRTWKLKAGVKNQYKAKPIADVDRLDTFYFLNLVWETK